MKTAADYAEERIRINEDAERCRRLSALGAAKVPGLRPQDCYDAGRVWEAVEAGHVSAEGWADYVEGLRREGRVRE